MSLVIVSGKVFGGKHVLGNTRCITLLDVGAYFPNQLLTLLIDEPVRMKFDKAPENEFKDKNVVVQGRITLYEGKPQIIIYKYWQLRLSEEEMKPSDGPSMKIETRIDTIKSINKS